MPRRTSPRPVSASLDVGADPAPDTDSVTLRDLVVAADICGVTDALPAEMIARAGTMAGLEASLQRGLTKISSLITAFGPGSEPDRRGRRG